MIRDEFWNRAKDLLAWCSDAELRMLDEQLKLSIKAHHDRLTVKFDDSDFKKVRRSTKRINRG